LKPIQKVKVEILGKTFAISGETSPAYLKKLAKYVNDKMKKINQGSSNKDLGQLAILVALNIADEYLQIKDLKIDPQEDWEEKIQAVIDDLDKALIGEIPE